MVYIGLVAFILAYWLLAWANNWGVLSLPISRDTFGVIGAFVNILFLVGLIPIIYGSHKSSRIIPSCAFQTMMPPIMMSAVKEMNTTDTDPVNLCERMDTMLGSGAEAIVHEMMSAYGYARFGAMLNRHPSNLDEKIASALINKLASSREESLSCTIEDEGIPKIKITIKNPPIKSTKGSAKRLLSSFWAGVFSRYYGKQLNCKDHCYNEGNDEFSFTISP